MGKFDGILIVSDIDGTLYNSRCEVSAENCRAIAYFKSEGGRFSLASGRTLPDVTEIDTQLGLCNAPLIGSNGAFAGRGDTVILQSRFDAELPQYVQRLIDCCDYSDIEFVTSHGVYVLQPNALTDIHRRYVSDPFTVIERVEEMPPDTAMMAFWMPEERIPDFRRLTEELGLAQRYTAFQGFRFSYEMVPHGFSKGAAARRVCEHIGCHTLVCAGDQHNDLSMLAEADVSFAPTNAVDEARRIATVPLKVSCDDSIYPVIVDYLEQHGS